MVVPWVLGFVAYQLINPGYVSWWANWWSDVRPFDVQSWMSASLLSFAVAALATVPAGLIERTLRAAPPRGR